MIGLGSDKNLFFSYMPRTKLIKDFCEIFNVCPFLRKLRNPGVQEKRKKLGGTSAPSSWVLIGLKFAGSNRVKIGNKSKSKPFFLMVRKGLRKRISESISWVTINVIYMCSWCHCRYHSFLIARTTHLQSRTIKPNDCMNRS